MGSLFEAMGRSNAIPEQVNSISNLALNLHQAGLNDVASAVQSQQSELAIQESRMRLAEMQRQQEQLDAPMLWSDVTANMSPEGAQMLTQAAQDSGVMKTVGGVGQTSLRGLQNGQQLLNGKIGFLGSLLDTEIYGSDQKMMNIKQQISQAKNPKDQQELTQAYQAEYSRWQDLSKSRDHLDPHIREALAIEQAKMAIPKFEYTDAQGNQVAQLGNGVFVTADGKQWQGNLNTLEKIGSNATRPTLGPEANLAAYRLGIDPTKPLSQEQGKNIQDEVARVEQAKQQFGTMNDAQVEETAKQLVAGQRAPSQIKWGIGTKAAANQAMVNERTMQLDPNYNWQTADANYKWYSAQPTQRVLRRMDTLIQPEGGTFNEAIKAAQAVNNPAGTPINALTGKAKVAFGNSTRNILTVVNGLSSEEMQQLFGSGQGGQKFLELAQSLSNPDLSVQQYVDAVNEMKRVVSFQYLSYAKGTPLQRRAEELKKNIETSTQPTQTKTLNGVTYTFSNGQWMAP